MAGRGRVGMCAAFPSLAHVATQGQGYFLPQTTHSIARHRPDPCQARRNPQNQAHKLTWALTSFSFCLIFALTEQIFVPSGQIEQTQFGCHRLGLQTEGLWSHSPPCLPHPHHVSIYELKLFKSF